MKKKKKKKKEDNSVTIRNLKILAKELYKTKENIAASIMH